MAEKIMIKIHRIYNLKSIKKLVKWKAEHGETTPMPNSIWKQIHKDVGITPGVLHTILGTDKHLYVIEFPYGFDVFNPPEEYRKLYPKELLKAIETMKIRNYDPLAKISMRFE